MSRAITGQFSLEQNQYKIGDIGFFLYVISIVGLGYIATFYGLFPTYSFPIIFSMLLGLVGLVLALATGGLLPQISRLGITSILVVIIVLFFFTGLGYVVTFIKPQSPVSVLLTLPSLVSIMFFGFVGVQEEFFWRGLYITMRRIFPGVLSWLLIILSQVIGGIIFHQAVALALFGGTLFSAPGYFIWIGISWLVYGAVLEVSKNLGLTALIHMTWNIMVTIVNLMQIQQSQVQITSYIMQMLGV